jgi:aminoglycoside 6'-N-acetyltransferase
MRPGEYLFHPMSEADLPRVRAWLGAPHVTQWWGDPDAQYALVRGDLAHPDMQQWIVSRADRAFAYLQCYRPEAWPTGGLGSQPPGTRGIDQFIGEADMVGRGHGSAFIRAFADEALAAGAPRIITDPHPANARAVRAYEKAGFLKQREVVTPDGRALLMVRNA